MRKASMMVLMAAFLVLGLAPSSAVARGKKAKGEKTAASEQLSRWHGFIVRMDKDASALDVRRKGVEKRIHYDSATKWTKDQKIIEMSEVKEGDDVICLGKYDEKGTFHAAQIDLRKPK